MTKKHKLASIGLDVTQVRALKQLLVIYAKQLDSNWDYIGDFDAQEVVATMGSQIDADLRLIDTDTEYGKRVWYFLQALEDQNSLIAFTNAPQQVDTTLFIEKPITTNIGTLVSLLNCFCC